jgi:predicted phage terminase large subunit-like protein
MTERLFTYPVSPKQDLFCRSDSLVTGFCAGRGAGKSQVGALRVIERARDGQRWMAAAPTYTMIEDATYAAFEEVAKKLRVWITGTRGTKPKVLFRTQDRGQAQLSFRSADNPERLRGPSLPGLWLDEASLMHKNAFLIGLATLRHQGQMGELVLTFTPRGRRHWTFETFYEELKSDDPIRELIESGKAEYGDYQIKEIGGRYYRPKSGTQLVRAHTLENPFLPQEYYASIKSHYSSTLAAQELAGEFVDLEGLIFRGEWFHFVEAVPAIAARCRYWDRAASHGSGKYTAGVLLAYTPDGLWFVEDVIRGQWSAKQRDDVIVETAKQDERRYGNTVFIVGEQEGGSAGKEISEQFIRRLVGYPVYRDIVSGKRHRIIDKVELPGEAKIVRAMGIAAQAEAGNVYLKYGPWNDEFLLELTGFPDYAFSDQVDAVSGAFNWLTKFGNVDPGTISRPEIEQDTEHFGLTLVRSRQRRRGL